MNDRITDDKSSCLVLQQHRDDSEYNDFIGKYYHFPKKYLNLLSENKVEFIYYEPKTRGEGVYFGYGKIGKIFTDKKTQDHYFAEILEYRDFATPVSFYDDAGTQRETDSTYNAQNAVRRISSETLEGICLDGGITLHFIADAHLIKVLGEQLIASEKVGILELVKNAYDAQASYCTVTIEKVAALPEIEESLFRYGEYQGPVIVIEDDGVGMTREVIENGWLRPASTLKTNVKERLRREKEKAIEAGTLGTYESFVKQLKREYKNRIPLGEKGVGRFATHRLGKYLLIKTKVRNVDYEYVLQIDWARFDQVSDIGRDLHSIGVSLTRQKTTRDYGLTGSGTQIIIHGGKAGFEWDRETIEELNRSILSLNSPNPNPTKNTQHFKASLICPQIPDLPDRSYLGEFEPVLVFDGSVNESGVLDYDLTFQPPKSVPMPPESWKDPALDLRGLDKNYWKSVSGLYRSPRCGSFYLHLEIWYRDEPWISGPNAKSFKDYLADFGGISIYRDGINIFPAEWGAETDWLNLKTRHIKKGWNISYYNFIGNLEVDQFDNNDLTDKTDREGLIRNQAYQDFVKLVSSIILTIIENKFKDLRDKYSDLTKDIVRDPKILQQATTLSSKIVRNIQVRYPIIEDPYTLLQEIGSEDQRKEKLINLERSMANLHKSLELIEEEKDFLTEQAGFGLAIAVSIHEIAKITSNFYYGVNELLKKGKLSQAKLLEIKESSSSLQSELKRLSPLRAVRSEKRVEFEITKAITFVRNVFKNRFLKEYITFDLDKGGDFMVYARYGAIVQIFSNLIDNSCYWLDAQNKPGKKIRIQLNAKTRTATVADSGPGIHEAMEPYLFKAGYSMKIPPSGLGLYICKYYMQSMRGDIYLTHGRERIQGLAGAQFTLDFEKVAQHKEDQI